MSRTSAAVSRAFTYDLERLFVDQDRDWVIETIAPVLAWVPGETRPMKPPPFRFEVDHTTSAATTKITIDLGWDEATLERLVPGVTDHARRLRAGRSAQREHVTELAAYGLTFVAISTLMPGRRVVAMQQGAAPDILFDATPGALRGVEAAGRTTGGRTALAVIRNGQASRRASGALGKAQQLLARTDLAEVHLSLWCGAPRVATLEQLR